MSPTIRTLKYAAIATALVLGSATSALAFSACQVTDTGGIDDNSFNQTAWKGIQDAQEQLGIEPRFLESQAETDYMPNINSLLGGQCDLIITVGFLLGDATQEAAEANPGQKFSIVDFAYDPAIPNVVGQVFATDQAAFLAGYLAAGMTETGIIGTFGGINIPPVTIFMDGFVRGADYHNAQKGTEVTVLGWDLDSREGLFTNNFESLDDGRAFAQNLYDEGADIVLPVACRGGRGSAARADDGLVALGQRALHDRLLADACDDPPSVARPDELVEVAALQLREAEEVDGAGDDLLVLLSLRPRLLRLCPLSLFPRP